MVPLVAVLVSNARVYPLAIQRAYKVVVPVGVNVTCEAAVLGDV